MTDITSSHNTTEINRSLVRCYYSKGKVGRLKF